MPTVEFESRNKHGRPPRRTNSDNLRGGDADLDRICLRSACKHPSWP